MNARKPTESGATGSRRSSSASGKRPRVRPSDSGRLSPTSARASTKQRAKETPRRKSASMPGRSSAYNAPSVWTKDAPSPRSGNPFVRVLKGIGTAFVLVFSLIGKGIGALVRGIGHLFSKSRVALVASCVVVLLLVVGLVDFGLHVGKAYPGVHVGSVDVGGKSAEEIARALDELYGARLAEGTVTIYANDQAAAHVADKALAAQDVALAEQLAVEDARANKQAWTTDAAALGAHIPSSELAAKALAVGREDGGVAARLEAFFSGRTLEVGATYDEEALEELAADIDKTIGDARVDFDIAIEEGQASVTEGHDGSMINRDMFAGELDRAFLENEDGSGSFVARVQYASLRIDQTAAQKVADAVNAALARDVRFTYQDTTWSVEAAEVGSWVDTRIDEHEGSFALVPFIDESQVKPDILAHLATVETGAATPVTFEVSGDDVAVHTDGSGVIPRAAQAASDLDAALFGDGAQSDASDGAPVEIAVGTETAPRTLSFDEALDRGVISAISSFTTEFATGEGTENRTHNIELVSKLLSNSVAKAHGGRWSFNETAGECNAERGFLGAGAIIAGEYDDAIGGGICQVATTVFNAVYDAGYPVPRRYNHSLYIASYPEGRDAAVSWPDLDLVWENDGDSDVLMRLSCGEGEVTATLYGVDPGYQVFTDTGEWSAGETYKVRTKLDESMEPGTSYIETKGTDGRSITVIRTVKDEAGTILHEDVFSSKYDPVTEVVVKGPDVTESTGTTDVGAPEGSSA